MTEAEAELYVLSNCLWVVGCGEKSVDHSSEIPYTNAPCLSR